MRPAHADHPEAHRDAHLDARDAGKPLVLCPFAIVSSKLAEVE